MKQFKFLNNVVGWLAFLISAIVYILTLEPTASFWDCGEFITTAYKIQVGHPPGAPFFVLMGRFFSIFASGPSQVAYMMNLMSALASAATILMLFWTITHIARKIIAKDGEFTLGRYITILGAGFVGALTYTFSDTFWFSAVEAEVYASSSLFTALVFWAILKWEDSADEPFANRWIILIAYLVGISIGVHLLNLLAIPAIVFVYYFRKYEVSKKGILYASAISVFLLGAIMYGIVPYLVIIASKFELLFVNSFGLPYNSGNFFYLILLIGGIVYGLYYTLKNNKVIANTILLAVTVIILGYSSFAIVVVRSYANPPMDQNNPETVFKLLSYLNREQYGDRPLFFGQNFNSPIDRNDPMTQGSPVYIQKDGKYIISEYKQEYNWDSNFNSPFPRMYSPQDNHVTAYKKWSKFQGNPINHIGQDGKNEVIEKPTLGDHVRYLFNYQINWMYFRYFMWNFSGRQNDIQGHDGAPGRGEVNKGNWITGISFLDDARLGPQDKLPQEYKVNKGHNRYYMLPLILGILGMIFLYRKGNKDFWVTLLLFFFTGIAIVFYLNQTPYQPRERDYAYAGSFYAYAIFIGIGVLGFIEGLKKFAPSTVASIAAVTISFFAVPVVLASENWDDHDRSNRYTARDFAINYLESCEPNAILFTNGDNDTFPLWYAQEVEGIRTDVRVCNLSYLSTDWYIDQMKKKAYKSEPVPFSMTEEQYVQGKRDYIPVYEQFKDYKDIRQIVDFVKSDDSRTKIKTNANESLDYIPTKKIAIPVNKEEMLAKKVVSPRYANLMVDEMQWNLNKSFVGKNDMMIIDLLASFNWDRPVYYAITVGRENYIKLEEFFQLEGLAYRIVPIKTPVNQGQMGLVNTDLMYEHMMNKFKWGNMNNPNVYLDENNVRMLMNFRSNFGRLGLALINEGQIEKAKLVADRCIELMPDELVPYNYFSLGTAEIYYKTNQASKGNAITERLMERLIEEMDYYLALNSEQRNGIFPDVRRAMALLQESYRVVSTNKQDALAKKMEESFKKYASLLE